MVARYGPSAPTLRPVTTALLVLIGIPLVILYFYLDYKLNRAIFTELWRGGKRAVAACQRRRAERRDTGA